MIPLYQIEQICQLESLLMENGASVDELMEKAGTSAFQELVTHWPKAHSIVVFVGKGNNGGDGLVLARLAQKRGLSVTLYSIYAESDFKTSALYALKKCQAVGLHLQKFSAEMLLSSETIIVDALLGTGFVDAIPEDLLSVIHFINQTKNPVLSIDVPSGLNANTGFVEQSAVRADVTVTFIALKAGLFTGSASAVAGEIKLATLGIQRTTLDMVLPFAELLNDSMLKKLLPKRTSDTHKGHYGHVLVVGGDYGMGGAVRMAAEAAMRVGAGLVTVATRPEHVSIVSGCRPEIMCHEITDPQDLMPLLKKASVIVLGPGLGKSDWSMSLFNKLMHVSLPKLLDADALNLLSENFYSTENCILTPHAAEAARLLNRSITEVQQDRFNAAIELQEKYGGVVVLKGPGTIIYDENNLNVCPAGNPGMATAGMGDLLSGTIGGLMAQGLTLSSAAQAGVLIHSMAADIAAEEGGERGLLATDLLSHIRRLANPRNSSAYG